MRIMGGADGVLFMWNKYCLSPFCYQISEFSHLCMVFARVNVCVCACAVVLVFITRNNNINDKLVYATVIPKSVSIFVAGLLRGGGEGF